MPFIEEFDEVEEIKPKPKPKIIVLNPKPKVEIKQERTYRPKPKQNIVGTTDSKLLEVYVMLGECVFVLNNISSYQFIKNKPQGKTIRELVKRIKVLTKTNS